MRFVYLYSVVICAFLASCKNTSEEKNNPTVPAETRSTLEYNQKQLDTIPKDTLAARVFKGGGGEPFWSIEINAEKILFNTPERNISAATPAADISDGRIAYSADYDSGKLKVILKKENCTDGMSGKEHSHQVEVAVRENNRSPEKTYSGCGSYGSL